MNKTVNLDIPADAATRARQNVIREVLHGLVTHTLSLDQAARALEHLIKAETDEVLKRCHLSNRAEA